MIIKKSAADLDVMHRAGKVYARVMGALAEAVAPGVTTLQLDRLAEKLIRAEGAAPSFLGYRGFPASICASVNNVIVHGIPSSNPLREGDIVSIDVGIKLDGFHADGAWTFPVGAITDSARKLLATCEQALLAGVEQSRIGRRLSDISHAIESLAQRAGYGIVREFVGHGIGRDLHEEPQLPNFGPPGRGPVLEAGLVLAIEPMLTVGDWKSRTLEDGWTVVTQDGSLAAHFEHTVAIGDLTPSVLTAF